MTRKNMFGLGLLISAGVVMTMAYDRNSVVVASIAALFAYVAGQLVSEPVLQCEDCGTSLIDDQNGKPGDDDHTDEPKPGDTFYNPCGRRESECMDGMCDCLNGPKWFNEPNRSRLADHLRKP